MIGKTLEESEDESSSDNESDSDNEEITKKQLKIADNESKVLTVQKRLLKKVLPILQRHLTQTKKEITTIRSFVAVSIAKVIRRLPVD